MSFDTLRKNKISQVLKVNDGHTLSKAALSRHGITGLHVAMEDHPDYEIDVEEELEPCMKFIQEGMDKNTGTLVICTAGMSRSATVCIAYLMKYKKMEYRAAYALVKKARPYIIPNKGFREFLKKYETTLRHDKNCALCNLDPKNPKTQHFPEHSECKALLLLQNQDSEFVICICEECEMPMIVYKGKMGHH